MTATTSTSNSVGPENSEPLPNIIPAAGASTTAELAALSLLGVVARPCGDRNLAGFSHVEFPRGWMLATGPDGLPLTHPTRILTEEGVPVLVIHWGDSPAEGLTTIVRKSVD